jgi:hypothetical protein
MSAEVTEGIRSRIYAAAARLSDKKSLETLLEPLKDLDIEYMEDLRDQLNELRAGKKNSVRQPIYDTELQTGRYIVSDGRIVLCYSVTGIDFEEFQKIIAAADKIRTWNGEAFDAAVAGALAVEIVSVQ